LRVRLWRTGEAVIWVAGIGISSPILDTPDYDRPGAGRPVTVCNGCSGYYSQEALTASTTSCGTPSPENNVTMESFTAAPTSGG
jgi:hypothetical protein